MQLFTIVVFVRARNSIANVTLEILEIAGLEEASLGFALADRDSLQVDGDVGDEHLIRDLGPREPQLGRGRPRRKGQMVLLLLRLVFSIAVDCVVIAYGRQIRSFRAVFLGDCWGRLRRRCRLNGHAILRRWNVRFGS